MYRVEMLVDGVWYTYGTYENRNKANEVAIYVRNERNVEVNIVEVK